MNNYIITIGREFCSSGSNIGSKLAEDLGIPYYDKQIIDKTAELLNFNNEIVAQNDEQEMSLWNSFGYQESAVWYSEDPTLSLPVGLRIADAQFKVIENLAKEGPCVIVGRCSNYILKDNPDAIHIFITADNDSRIKRAMRLSDLSEEKAKKLIKKTDKTRANYYNMNTGEKWGDPHNYNLVINSAMLGEEATVKAIEEYIKVFDGEKKEKI